MIPGTRKPNSTHAVNEAWWSFTNPQPDDPGDGLK
jgi:hypothetical protein